ncbi:tetratricopeptide repeat protein [Candidatus Gracilibacteria bacterium]|nr:tetratricopeptide repeat protein [Candidatus Gracilibacteria bacterium]NJM90453.1 tetratricopeptide repeat protein [Hydrococcus sp. RU_2_2]NJP22281.1 tetratricopeptide repeat protein [Hydrococcus sp. CRU_1_1]
MVSILQPKQKVEPLPTPSPTVSSVPETSISHFLKKGNAKADEGDYQGAIDYYDQAISLNPEYALAYNNRGFAYWNLKEYQKAISNYNKAISLNSEYALAYNNRGNAKSDLGDKQGAIADFEKAAELYQKQGDYQNAQDALERVNKLQ